jgi:hypothetical protein
LYPLNGSYMALSDTSHDGMTKDSSRPTGDTRSK